jgi:hypothetical protein
MATDHGAVARKVKLGAATRPVVSVDDQWSAFSLRKYKPGEARQTFR